MKSQPKPRRAATAQQTAFQLKHRVVLSLNKLADRDTQQIGADELDRFAESLTADTVGPFLSCVADTDSDTKPAVRRECVRVMGAVARLHAPLLGPHLSKMVASIVKRLKDTDSVVRDACVEAAGVIAMNVGGGEGFVALARPLFEALGEQNRYVQAGAGLCLAKVIDEAAEPPGSVLPQMLGRVIKLLKNPHFMAKPAVIELIRSIVQAGGASTEHTLSTAVTAILEALKSNDWITRKTASVALAGIAVSAGPLLGSFRTSCLRSLEGYRFDKVKPVRDAILHAIQCWKALPGTHSPEPSEAGSSTKENFIGDSSHVTNANDGEWRDASFRKSAFPASALSGNSANLTKIRTPLTVRRSPNYVQNLSHVKSDDWHIEIALPKTQTMPLAESHHEESGGSCAAKGFERSAAATRRQTTKYDYDPTDDKPDCSSVSDLVSASFETKHVTFAHDCSEEYSGNFMRDRRSSPEVIDPEDLRLQDHKSLDSTVTDSCSPGMHECCLHATNELAFIRKQLLEIETKQSNLMDLLQVFVGNSTNGLSTLQLKVHNLEHTVDKIANSISQNENYLSIPGSKLLKRNQSVSSSPRLSTSTPRPSVDANYRQPSQVPTRNRETVENTSSRGRSSASAKDASEMWRDPTLSIIRNPMAKPLQKNPERSVQSSGTRGSKDSASVPACNSSARQGSIEGKAMFWKQIKDSLCVGDVESAYMEVLCSGDDLCLVELMDRTGPVLERLSHDTATEILSTVASHFLHHRFLDTIIPWLQQVVDLGFAHEPMHFALSAKERMEFLLAMEEVAAMEFADPIDRTLIAKLAGKLSQVWGDASCRAKLPRHSTRVRQNAVC